MDAFLANRYLVLLAGGLRAFVDLHRDSHGVHFTWRLRGASVRECADVVDLDEARLASCGAGYGYHDAGRALAAALGDIAECHGEVQAVLPLDHRPEPVLRLAC